MIRKKELDDIKQGLTSNPLSFKGVNVRSTLELDPIKRPWNKAPAISVGFIRTRQPREAFDIKWVDTGLRVPVTLPPERLVLPRWLRSPKVHTGPSILTGFGSLHRKLTPKSCNPSCWTRDVEGRAPASTIVLNREQGEWCCELLDDLRH